MDISKIHAWIVENVTELVKFAFAVFGFGLIIGAIAYGMATMVQIFVGNFSNGFMYLGLAAACFYIALGIIGVLKQLDKDGKLF